MPRMTFPPVYWDGDNRSFLFSSTIPNLFTQQQQQITTCFPSVFNVSFGSSSYQNYSSPSSFVIPPAPTSMCFQQFSQIYYPILAIDIHSQLTNQSNDQRNDQLLQTYHGEQVVLVSRLRSQQKNNSRTKHDQ
jgi:hypothetical protein